MDSGEVNGAGGAIPNCDAEEQRFKEAREFCQRGMLFGVGILKEARRDHHGGRSQRGGIASNP